MTHCDPDDWEPREPRPTVLDRVITFVLRALVIGVAVVVLTSIGLFAGWMMYQLIGVASAEPVLLVVDEHGAAQLECELPAEYLLPPHMAIVCPGARKPATIYRSGFES